MNIAIDIMNGDNSPSSVINGAIQFLKKSNNTTLYLVGKKKIFNQYKKKLKSIKSSRYVLTSAEEDILDSDSITRLFKNRRESSLIKCIQLLKDKTVDAVVSAGNTGGLLASSLIMLGKIKDIRRPALGAYIPTEKGGFVLCDVGANSNNKPIHLLQFSLMASAYIKYLENIKEEVPKSTDINVLLNRVKTNQKNESRKKLYFSAAASTGLILFGLLIF